MQLTPEVRAAMRRTVVLLDRLPDGEWVEFSFGNPGLYVQAATQDRVRRIRACFPGTRWSKSWDETTGWTYDTKVDGVLVSIYAVQEAPPACRLVETTEEVEEPILAPTGETRRVTRIHRSWECGPDSDEAPEAVDG